MARTYGLLSCILILLLAVGCSRLVEQRPSKPEQPVKTEQPLAQAKTPLPPPGVAILLSSEIPAYRDVANVLRDRLGARAAQWHLNGSAEENAKVVAEIAKSSRSQVVAIGLDAAVSAKKLTDKQIIFCQVFNYEEHHLAAAKRKGVSMLPSFKVSFAAWKAIAPGLKQVAIITGPGLDEYVHKAKVAAKAKGITLVHREVNSDKEFLVEYKNLASQVEGYWLWPDNRVLSGVVLREVLTFSMRSGKQAAVFNDELLELGGMISITSDPRDVANNVLARLDRAAGKSAIPGNVIEPLDVANLRINSLMVKRLGLAVPKKYRKYLDAP